MLKLKSSARDRKRYILINGKKEDVERAILDYIGILGWAKASPRFVSFGRDSCVLAVNREQLENVKASFVVSDKQIDVLRVSGTLKGLRKT